MSAKLNGATYNPANLAVLSDALSRALASAFNGKIPNVPAEEVKDLGGQLGRVILHHFEAGDTDPEVLKAKALEQVLGPDL